MDPDYVGKKEALDSYKTAFDQKKKKIVIKQLITFGELAWESNLLLKTKVKKSWKSLVQSKGLGRLWSFDELNCFLQRWPTCKPEMSLEPVCLLNIHYTKMTGNVGPLY